MTPPPFSGVHSSTTESATESVQSSVQDITITKNTVTQKSGDSCGCSSNSSPAPSFDQKMLDRISKHPCYSEEAHHHYARMHVAVAPACNIQCNYCNRKYDCANESRPGVVSELLTPEEAAHKVLVIAGKIPQMTVLGIAGPGLKFIP